MVVWCLVAAWRRQGGAQSSRRVRTPRSVRSDVRRPPLLFFLLPPTLYALAPFSTCMPHQVVVRADHDLQVVGAVVIGVRGENAACLARDRDRSRCDLCAGSLSQRTLQQNANQEEQDSLVVLIVLHGSSSSSSRALRGRRGGRDGRTRLRSQLKRWQCVCAV